MQINVGCFYFIKDSFFDIIDDPELMKKDVVKLQEYTKPNADGFSPMTFDGQTFSNKEMAGKKLVEKRLFR